MKKLLLLLPFLIHFSAHSQTSVYHPFPDSNAKWCSEYGYGDGVECGHGSMTYLLDGNISINGNIYNRLLHYDTLSVLYCMFGNYWYSRLDTVTYYIRQDSVQKKVWIYDSTSNSDKIFYNFNLNIGDTLDTSKVYWAQWPPFDIITSIDSVIIAGQYRKRYNYGTACNVPVQDTSMIEGIGGLHGLMNAPACFEAETHLIEFTQNNQMIFEDTVSYPLFLYCYDFSTRVDENEFNKKPLLLISPNPFHTTASLQLNTSFSQAELKIYNVLGGEVKRQKITSQTTVINRDGMADGIYFISVSDGEKEWRGRMVVE
jgi:hypothetical protein